MRLPPVSIPQTRLYHNNVLASRNIAVAKESCGLAFGRTPRNGPPVSSRPPLPRNVWVLGFVSLLMDLSSEIYHALLPAFITMVLGLPATALGAIDGVAEATASFAKLFSGRLSDRTLRRKPWVMAGYGLAAVSKPLFPLAA